MGKAFRPEDVVFYFEGRITQATERSLGLKGKKSRPKAFGFPLTYLALHAYQTSKT